MHLDIQHRGGGGIRNDQVPHAHTSAHIVPINNVWWCKRPCIYSTIVQCSAVTSKYCWNWPFSNGDISKIHRVHKNFLSANESSIFQRPINKILEIFTESKICYEFSKLGRKLRFFSKKSEILNFSKKKFWHAPSTHTDKHNLFHQKFCRINYLASRTKNSFSHI